MNSQTLNEHWNASETSRRQAGDRVVGHLRPRLPAGRRPERPLLARLIESPAFVGLGALARGDGDVPLPRLERVAAGKARLVALAEARRSALTPARAVVVAR